MAEKSKQKLRPRVIYVIAIVQALCNHDFARRTRGNIGCFIEGVGVLFSKADRLFFQSPKVDTTDMARNWIRKATE